jgi:hypothetical protein
MMSSTLTNLTAATTWSGTDLFYALVGGNSRKIAASSFWVCESANVLSDVNGTTAQTVRVYRTFTDSSNYERLALTSNTGYMEIAAQTAGTGTDNLDIRLTPAGTGQVLTGNAGFGYASGIGAGSDVTQTTSKSTAVTSNTISGRITMHAEALGAGASVTFTVNNNIIVGTDLVIINRIFGGTGTAYTVDIQNISSLVSFSIRVTNISGGSLSEQPVIAYAIIRGASS